MGEEPLQIPPGVRPLDSLMDPSASASNRAVRSLAEARQDSRYAVIMDGDFGGQVFLTCPVMLIRCTETALQQLFHDIVSLSKWDGEGLWYQIAPPGSPIAGGMGGGIVLDRPWIHDEFVQAGIAGGIEAVLESRASDLLTAIGPNTLLPKGITFFQFALQAYDENFAIRCLDAGADPLPPDDEGLAALHRAASHGHLRLIDKLLDAGVSTDLQDANGRTALHHAALSGKFEATQRLVERGAKALRSRFGLPSRDAARIYGRQHEIYTWLRQLESQSGHEDDSWWELT